jgi:glycosyltransferase involved in cell wall biosynthesis
MANSSLDITVVICAYSNERWGDLRAAVESVRHQDLQPCEVVVVIDHNPDLYARAREGLAGAVVVENQEPRGLSGARNSGIAAASGEVIAFLDDDAIAADGWLRNLNACYTDHSVIGAGGSIEPLWQTGRPHWFPAEFDWVVGCTYRGMPLTRAPVRNLIGANMSFRRDVFDAVGGFRNGMGRLMALPAGCEETELCIRARQHWPSRQLTYEPQARVSHRVPYSRSGWRYFRSRCFAEGLSKALVARFVGAGDGLASERSYTLRTLPSGAWRGLLDSCSGADATGVTRAGAIVAGFNLTLAGYLAGSIKQLFKPSGA